MGRDMKTFVCTVLVGGLIATSLTGCEGMGPKEQQYTMAGCATGLLAGLGMGLGLSHGNAGGAVAGAAAGTAVGCLAGNAIGRQLDERDRQQQQLAIYAALDAPRPVARNWTSDHGTGNHGKVSVSAPVKTAQGECKNVNEVAYVHGQEATESTKYCRNSQGEWTEA
jgi:surface antigen